VAIVCTHHSDCLTLLRDTAYSAVEENLRAFRGPDWVTRR